MASPHRHARGGYRAEDAWRAQIYPVRRAPCAGGCATVILESVPIHDLRSVREQALEGCELRRPCALVWCVKQARVISSAPVIDTLGPFCMAWSQGHRAFLEWRSSRDSRLRASQPRGGPAKHSGEWERKASQG